MTAQVTTIACMEERVLMATFHTPVNVCETTRGLTANVRANFVDYNTVYCIGH